MVVIKVLNNTACIINLVLSVWAPYYTQDKIMPHESMVRSVGRVWFTIQTQMWKGPGDGPKSPHFITDVNGQNFTVKEHLAIRGMHPNLLVSTIVKSTLSPVEKLLDEPYPMYIRSPGWYMGRDRTIAIQGGPQCEHKEIVYKIGDQVVREEFQIIDLNSPVKQFELVGID